MQVPDGFLIRSRKSFSMIGSSNRMFFSAGTGDTAVLFAPETKETDFEDAGVEETGIDEAPDGTVVSEVDPGADSEPLSADPGFSESEVNGAEAERLSPESDEGLDSVFPAEVHPLNSTVRMLAIIKNRLIILIIIAFLAIRMTLSLSKKTSA